MDHADHQPKIQPEDDEDYHSSSDEDFNPETAPADENISESEAEDGEGDEPASGRPCAKKRRKTTWNDDRDSFDSGDEAIVRKGKKRRKGHDKENDEEGGDGGLIKTRAQRAKEGKEKKALADTSSATVDVDALWANMKMTTARPPSATAQPNSESNNGSAALGENPKSKEDGPTIPKEQNVPTTNPRKESREEEETITIKRTYDFAGETISEEKRVLKSSAEARLYLESQSSSAPVHSSSTPSTTSGPSSKPLRRPKKRTSMFDPGPSTPLTTGSPVGGMGAKGSPSTKLNTIEKSKLDWAGFVDKEGINDELDEHSRAKEGYLGRMDFLSEVERKREEERRRQKGI